jgi:hypothetical protein
MLSEYIDSKLNSADKGIVEAHLEVCDTCSKELEALRMTVQLLHRVPEVSIPRPFTVVAPRRERVFVPSGLRLPRPVTAVAAIPLGPRSLRWLRPATAVAAIALVLLLVGDFVHVFENDSGVDGGGEATSTYSQSVTPTVATEKQIMVKVPGVMGQMSLATARSVGYTKYDVLPSTPVSQPPAQPILIVPENEVSSQDGVMAQGEAGVGWPLRQIEIALGAVVFVLVVLMILSRRRHSRVVA